MSSYASDYHTHTRHSVDAGDRLLNFARAALEKNLQEVCFTDHVDFDENLAWNDFFVWEAFKTEFESVREISGEVSLKAGFEIDYQASHEDEVIDFLEDKNADFVIGSVHYVDGRMTMLRKFFEDYDQRESYERHFEEVLSAARSGVFDVLGHLDYPKRAGALVKGPFPFLEFRGVIEEILRAAIKTDTGIEINSAGYSHPPRETYPGFETVKLYRDLGGRILTFGSDSHEAATLGRGLKDAWKMAREAGFTEYTVFEKRKFKFVPIPS